MNTLFLKSTFLVVLFMSVLFCSGQTIETIQDPEAIAQVTNADYILHQRVKCISGKDKPCPMKLHKDHSMSCNCDDSSMIAQHNEDSDNQLSEEESQSLMRSAQNYFDAEEVISIMSYAIIELDERFYMYYVFQNQYDSSPKEVIFTMKE